MGKRRILFSRLTGDLVFCTRRGLADHVGRLGWEPERFFCVMGRAAAALAIIEQGQEITDRLPADMPEVAPEELDLVQDRLPALLRAVEADAGNGAPGSLQKK